MCNLINSWDTMARDDNTSALMGGNIYSGVWREGKEKTELIHSGHFMVSDPFKGEDKVKDIPDQQPGYDFQKYATSGTSESYKFHQTDLEIDSSFAKLFECLNLAYTGCKIVSPKWKTFKGQKVRLQDKIRLNNAIWREWHNQFILGKKPFLCHFSLPLLDNEYKAPTAVVLEGKYGKRTTTAVIGEYQRWRTFYMKEKKEDLSDGESMDWSQIANLSDRDFFSVTGQVPMVMDEDALLSEFSDTLFSSLNQSFIFPNPREFSHAGVSVDAIQPGLVGLQPPLEELMDTLDVLPDIKLNQGNAPFVFTAGNQSSIQSTETLIALQLQQHQRQQQAQQQAQQQQVQQQQAQQQAEQQAQQQAQQQQAQQQQAQQQQAQAQQASTSGLNQMILTNTILSPNEASLDSQDLNSLLVRQLQTSVNNISQVTPQQHTILGQQQQPTSATSITLTPQLLGQLLQIQLQQQQQQQQQVDQKNPTVLGLNSALLSSLNQNCNLGGNLQGMPSLLQPQQQQSNLTQAGGISIQPAVGRTTQLNQNQFAAVPVKLTRAVDIGGIGSRTLSQQNLNTIQIQNNQNRIVIAPQVQQCQAVAPSQANGTLLDPQQIQLLQRQSQAILQQHQQTILAPKIEQTNYMQDFDLNSAHSSNREPPLRGIRSSNQTLAEKKKMDDQNQALKLLQKVASHVSQSNTTNLKLFTPEQTNIFNRIFNENSETQRIEVVSQQKKPLTQQSKTTPPMVTSKHPQGTILYHSASVGSTNSGTTGAVQKDSHRKARIKQTLGKKPVLKPASPAMNSTNSSGGLGRANSRTLLTHLLTGGKYDPTSGIVLTTTSTAKPVTTISPSSVNSVVMTTINADHDQSMITKPRGNLVTATASSPPPVFTSANVQSNEPMLFTIGTSGYSSPEAKQTDGADGLDDKKNITAEQKRRTNIRCGFESLHHLIPSLSQNPSSKVSKAAMLHKGVDYMKKLQAEKSQLSEEMNLLKEEISTLNLAISESQSQLPASGVPVTRQRYDQMKENFDEYVRERTEQNWKFWIFSIIIKPLFESFNATVSTTSREELCRTVLSWLDRHCSLLALRPTVLSSLTLLSRITSILSDPAQVPQQAVQAANKRDQSNSID